MSDTTVSLLTPPGTGAIATVEVRGPQAWKLARKLFKPEGKPIPEVPEVNRFWFGTLESDDVIFAVTAADTIEVHCHGGRRVVRWVMDQFLAQGCTEERNPFSKNECLSLLQHAPTLRTASVLLDQLHGAFKNEVNRILTLLETNPIEAREPLNRIAELGNTIGRHLVEPWKVVVAGAPNVGKSSLVNALAGYQRSVVSETAGTTRDAVSVRVAFDGWPVELIDTAGLRDADGLEVEGIERAEQALDKADLVLWVMDGTAPKVIWPIEIIPPAKLLALLNKSDAMIGWGPDPDAWGLPLVSAVTGAGVGYVVVQIISKLVPQPLSPGVAVPFTPQLADVIDHARQALTDCRYTEAVELLRRSLTPA